MLSKKRRFNNDSKFKIKVVIVATILTACLFGVLCSANILPTQAKKMASSSRVRTLHLRRDEIAVVKTALGIATLIQVPDRPTSVVLGDTNAFKVEYLESAITIKPLSARSKSNLYIYTEGRRFNVTLVTGIADIADYIVYLEPVLEQSVDDIGESVLRSPSAKLAQQASQRWRAYSAEVGSHQLKMTVSRIGVSGPFLLVDFQVSTQTNADFKPDWIWLTQKGKTVPIERLELDGVELTKTRPVHGIIVVKRDDAQVGRALVFEMRSKHPLSIRLPEVKRWMK